MNEDRLKRQWKTVRHCCKISAADEKLAKAMGMTPSEISRHTWNEKQPWKQTARNYIRSRARAKGLLPKEDSSTSTKPTDKLNGNTSRKPAQKPNGQIARKPAPKTTEGGKEND